MAADGGTPPSDLEGAGSIDAVTSTCPALDLEIGMFFDGTGNNIGNVEAGILARLRGEPDEGGSYANDFSNVAKLSRQNQNAGVPNDCGGLAKKIVSEYVEGIGTETGSSDSTVGFALGWGETGVARRVEDAFLKFLRHVNAAKARGEVNEIKVDVFGFSRGAAAARHFVNCVHRGNAGHGYGGPAYEIQSEDHPKIKIRFLGMFDCVVSVGTVADDDNHGSLRIGLLDNSAEKIVHITAEDEFRENFSLTPGPGGEERIKMPGAHSDVGGGYASHWVEKIHIRPTETVHPRRFVPYPTDAAARSQILALTPEDLAAKSWLEAKGYIAPIDHAAYYREIVNYTTINNPYLIHTWLERPWVDHRLSRVSLNVMHQKAVDAGVPFPQRLPGSADYAIPADAPAPQTLFGILMSGSTVGGDFHKLLRRTYVHHSSHWAMSAIFYPMKLQDGNVRREWPNDAGEAIAPKS